MGLGSSEAAVIGKYIQQSASLVLYQSVLENSLSRALLTLLRALLALGEDQTHETATTTLTATTHCLTAYGQWITELANAQQSWQQHLIRQVLIADNAFSQQAQTHSTQETTANATQTISPGILAAAQYDLGLLETLYQLTEQQLSQWVQQATGTGVPTLNFQEKESPIKLDKTASWDSSAEMFAAYYASHGVGIFGQFTAFRWQASYHTGALTGSLARSLAGSPTGQLVGIRTPDPIALRQLAAYDHPKQQLIQNTESLLRGYAAQNVLLYGSRGAGKSSLVKALLNEYAHQGLRLIEVPKANLHNLPQIVEPLSQVPQKFIIFVDDLSFEEDDEAFKALKVVLEGGVTARPQNVVVYATSNRRHLIREFFDERPRPKDAEEIQAWDTVQEKLSFSDRFGLTLTFAPADQSTYLTIVQELAKQAGLTIEAENLDWRARQWATRHNGRSGRTARQFVDFLIAEQGK
ncbi:MAG: ATP-binding protein [Cyanobacteria bacterium J06597_16]